MQRQSGDLEGWASEVRAGDEPEVLQRYPGLPGLAPEAGTASPAGRLELDAAAWARGEVDGPRFDDRADELARGGPFELVLSGGGAGGGLLAGALLEIASEVALRCQRWSDRRNEASRGERFSAVLGHHRELHPLEKPLVWADYRHAVDVWQWALRLDPGAGAAVQIAALFHDIERVESEADARHEQNVEDYADYKARHAEASARLAERTLAPLGLPAAELGRALELVAGHDRPNPGVEDPEAEDPEARLLEDADALSFFGLNSSGYWDYYGERQVRRKVAWTLRRLSPRGLAWLGRVRLRPEVADVVTGERRAAGP